MKDAEKQEAKELADRAANQAKHAARNSGRAVKAVGEAVADDVVEESKELAHKMEDTANDAVRAARRLDFGVLSRISGDTGIGFLALSVSIYSGTIAVYKFRNALQGRKNVLG